MSNKNRRIYKATYISGDVNRTAEVWEYPNEENDRYAVMNGSNIFWFTKDQRKEAVKRADALVKGK